MHRSAILDFLSQFVLQKETWSIHTILSASIVLYFIYIPTFHRHLACLSVCPLFFL